MRQPHGSSSAPGTYDLVEVAEAMRLTVARVAEDPGSTAGPPGDHRRGAGPGARWASVSMVRAGRFTTAASTDDRAVRADLLQYELGTGPCVDAVLHNSVYVTGDVRTEPRWIEWGQRASAEVGVNSVLSQRLHHQHRGRCPGRAQHLLRRTRRLRPRRSRCRSDPGHPWGRRALRDAGDEPRRQPEQGTAEQP